MADITPLIARPPAFNFNQLADPFEGYMQGRQFRSQLDADAARKSALQDIPRGTDGAIDYNELAARLGSANDFKGMLEIAKVNAAQQQQQGVYGTPIYGQGSNGETVIGTFDKRGQFKQINTPGFTPTLPVKQLDTGTGFVATPGRMPFVGGQPGAQGQPGFAPPDPAYTIPQSQAQRANAPQPGSSAPIQPTPVQTRSVQPGFIPKNIEGVQTQEAAGKRVGETMAAASRSTKNLFSLSRASALLDQIEQGKLEPTKLTLSAWGSAFGVNNEALQKMGLNPNAPAVGQALNALISEMTIGKLGAGGFPAQNFSNTDLKFLTGTMPSLANDPRANKLLVEAAKRAAQRDIEKARQWREFKRTNPNASFDDFDVAWSQQAQKVDIFQDLEREAEILRSAPTQAPAQGDWQDIDGVKIRRRQ